MAYFRKYGGIKYALILMIALGFSYGIGGIYLAMEPRWIWMIPISTVWLMVATICIGIVNVLETQDLRIRQLEEELTMGDFKLTKPEFSSLKRAANLRP